MNTDSARRRYFIAEGPEADALREDVLKQFDDHRDRLMKFLAQYGTAHCMQRGGCPTAILLEEPATAPEGFKQVGRHLHDGKSYIECKPIGNTKIGRSVKKQMAEVGGFSASDLITKHYRCENWVPVGGSMWVATGWIHDAKKLVVIQVPEDEDHQFTPPPSFREIKKSEYVAITEEG